MNGRRNGDEERKECLMLYVKNIGKGLEIGSYIFSGVVMYKL